MTSIVGLQVLVVEDDADTRELLEFFLDSLGAHVRSAPTSADACAALRERTVDVILADIGLPDEDGFAFLARVRAEPAWRTIPAIAMTGYADEAWRVRALEVGFQKFVSKPYDVFALPAALVSAVSTTPPTPARDAADAAARIAVYLETRNVRGLLGMLNSTTNYRYTSILRFDDAKLESVWTFDRENDRVDAYPERRIEQAYCVFIEATGHSFSVADALEDVRVSGHPKREKMRSYCGVPLLRTDGSMFGTLCHYDPMPRAVDARVIAAMVQVAGMLTPGLTGADVARVAR